MRKSIDALDDRYLSRDDARKDQSNMWTRTYLLLLLVRLYFAVSPSYIHPDENFQGPEVIAGKLAFTEK